MPHCIRWDSFDPLHFTWPHLDPNDGNEHHLDSLGCMCMPNLVSPGLTGSRMVSLAFSYRITTAHHEMAIFCINNDMRRGFSRYLSENPPISVGGPCTAAEAQHWPSRTRLSHSIATTRFGADGRNLCMHPCMYTV